MEDLRILIFLFRGVFGDRGEYPTEGRHRQTFFPIAATSCRDPPSPPEEAPGAASP